MEEIKKDFKRAVLSVLATLVFCMCLCFVTMQAFISYDGGVAHIVHSVICFACLFIDVVISAFYAARSLREIYIKAGWKGVDKLPDQGDDDYDVAFITKEKCIFNGQYNPESQLFTSFDGAVFRKDEIISWCYDRRYMYFVRYFSYAPGYEF